MTLKRLGLRQAFGLKYFFKIYQKSFGEFCRFSYNVDVTINIRRMLWKK